MDLKEKVKIVLENSPSHPEKIYTLHRSTTPLQTQRKGKQKEGNVKHLSQFIEDEELKPKIHLRNVNLIVYFPSLLPIPSNASKMKNL